MPWFPFQYGLKIQCRCSPSFIFQMIARSGPFAHLIALIMGHYQEEEEGIGVKGFMSDRGSILKESPETPRAQPEDSKQGILIMN